MLHVARLVATYVVAAAGICEDGSCKEAPIDLLQSRVNVHTSLKEAPELCTSGFSIEVHTSSLHGDVCRKDDCSRHWLPPNGCERTTNGSPYTVQIGTNTICRTGVPNTVTHGPCPEPPTPAPPANCACVAKTCTPTSGDNANHETYYPAVGLMHADGLWCFVQDTCGTTMLGNHWSCDGSKFAFLDGHIPSWSTDTEQFFAVPQANTYALVEGIKCPDGDDSDDLHGTNDDGSVSADDLENAKVHCESQTTCGGFSYILGNTKYGVKFFESNYDGTSANGCTDSPSWTSYVKANTYALFEGIKCPDGDDSDNLHGTAPDGTVAEGDIANAKVYCSGQSTCGGFSYIPGNTKYNVKFFESNYDGTSLTNCTNSPSWTSYVKGASV